MMLLQTYLSCETTEESKEKLRKCESKVLVEEVAEKRGHSVIRPLAVYQEKTLKIPVIYTHSDYLKGME